jgi:hypothetical protein
VRAISVRDLLWGPALVSGLRTLVLKALCSAITHSTSGHRSQGRAVQLLLLAPP